MPKMPSYAIQANGIDVYARTKFIDDCLARAGILAQEISGTGDKDVPFPSGIVPGNIAVNLHMSLIPKAVNEAGDVKLDHTVDLNAKVIKVTATAGLQWKGTIVYQRADNDP